MRTASVIMLATLGVGLPAIAGQVPELAPGAFWIRGDVTPENTFSLSIAINPTPASEPQVLAAKVYSEPSHTLLLAALDHSASNLVADIQNENPMALTLTRLGASTPHVEVTVPPQSDERIKIDYVLVSAEGAVDTRTIADAKLSSFTRFEFSRHAVIWNPGLDCQFHCGTCGGDSCGCVCCTGPAFTVCCNTIPCSICCGWVVCESKKPPIEEKRD